MNVRTVVTIIAGSEKIRKELLEIWVMSHLTVVSTVLEYIVLVYSEYKYSIRPGVSTHCSLILVLEYPYL